MATPLLILALDAVLFGVVTVCGATGLIHYVEAGIAFAIGVGLLIYGYGWQQKTK